MTINKVITNSNYLGIYKERIISLFAPSPVIFVDDNLSSEEIKNKAKDCDVAFWQGNISPNIYEDSNLKWIHCNMAGLNGSINNKLFERKILLTGASGRSAPTLAEHVFFFMLNHVYKIRNLIDCQSQKEWGFEGIDTLSGLYGKTLGIAGFGNTGKAIAEKAKAFGMNILTYGTSNLTDFEKIFYGVSKHYCVEQKDRIEDFLPTCDYIVLSLRLTDKTYHIINEKTINCMKQSAYIINISRGSVIDEEYLIKAINNNLIDGAGLDVTEIEPLPITSKIWNMDKFLLTPHCTPKMPDMKSSCLDILEENIKRYKVDRPLLNKAKIEDIYTH